MKRVDLATLAAVCYGLTDDESIWLTDLSQLLGAWLDRGFGVAAWAFQAGAYGPSILPPVGVTLEIGQAMQAAAAATPGEIARQFFFGPRTGSASERTGFAGGLQDQPWFERLRDLGARDIGALTLLDCSGAGVAFAGTSPQVVRTTGQLRGRLERIGAHILAGFRLRRRLGEIDAVLASDGRLLDAQEEACAPEQREALRAAVKAFDRAGSTRVSDASDEALASWRGLVSGRWSLVQSFESDGRRYLVARRNPPGDGPHPGVSALEAHALLLRAQGASLKLIAYELGLSLSAAHGLVRRGCAKLGVGNEAELGRLFAQMPLR